MARRFRRMLAPINSTKHFVPRTTLTIASGGVSNNVIVEAKTLSSVGAASADVQEGATIKAVHLELWINGQSNTDESSFTITVEKIPAGADLPVIGDMLNLGAYLNKKNILYTSQGIVGQANNQSVPILMFWQKIPKGKQRFGLGDKLLVNILATNTDLQVCGMYIYKEYS